MNQMVDQTMMRTVVEQPKKVYYLDKQEFLNKIIDYRRTCRKAKKAKKAKPKIPDDIALCIVKIAENAAKGSRYSGYTFRDIMIADAVENCIRYFENFNPRHVKKNPFGYFSQCCIYAFWRTIENEKKELYGKYKIAQQAGIMGEFGLETVDGDDSNGADNIQQQQVYDNINDFIRKYEDSIDRKRKKKAERKASKKVKATKGLERFQE